MPKIPDSCLVKKTEAAKPSADARSVRLAVTDDGMPSKENRYPNALRDKTSPTIHLAHVPGAQGDNVLLGQRGVAALPETSLPALLVSYFYLDGFIKQQHRYHYRDWMMDSGAYSAYNSGAAIDLQEYIEACHRLRESDLTLNEIIALDVIGSGEGSLKNAQTMKEAGVECIPVFHIGEDWQILKEYCQGWDKVGLSCRFGEPMQKSYWFYDQCFARQWPKKFHSFGWMDEKMLMKYPFHSSDSSSWEVGPCAFASWKYFGKMSVRGSSQNLRTQVDWYLELEERLRVKWKKEMLVLESTGPTNRLCVAPKQAPNTDHNIRGFGKTDLSVRLVVGSGRSLRDTGINAFVPKEKR